MPEVMVLVKEEILQAVQRRKLHTDFRRYTRIETKGISHGLTRTERPVGCPRDSHQPNRLSVYVSVGLWLIKKENQCLSAFIRVQLVFEKEDNWLEQ